MSHVTYRCLTASKQWFICESDISTTLSLTLSHTSAPHHLPVIHTHTHVFKATVHVIFGFWLAFLSSNNTQPEMQLTFEYQMTWWNYDKLYKFKFTFLGRWLARNTNAKFTVLPTCIVMVIVISGNVGNAQLHEAMCGNVYFMFCHSPEVIAWFDLQGDRPDHTTWTARVVKGRAGA